MMQTERYLNTRMTRPSLERFESGSSHGADTIPSNSLPRRRTDSFDDDDEMDDMSSSMASFEIGVDPIDRHWDDARDYSRRGSRTNFSKRMPDKAHPLPDITYRKHAPCPPTRNSRPSSLYPCLERSERSMNDSGSFPEEEEQRYHGRQREKAEQALRLPKRTKSNEMETRRVQDAKDKSPSLKVKDQAEPATASRPELPPENQRIDSHRSSPTTPSFRGRSSFQHYRPTPRSTPPLRLVSGCALDGDSTHSDGSSVQSSKSRSAPVRRTPIPREPSLYRPGDSRPQRDFSYTRDALNRRNIRSHSRSIATVDNSIFTETGRRMSAGGKQMVSIAPGVEARLRGTKETYDAVGKDFYANVSCFGCSKELCCIADVSCVICPDCRVISPLEGCLFEGRELRREGLGLGFTYDCLFKMQTEIMKKRGNH